ncbi:hypothetical protein Hanom_Chr09g00846041 [Helianthus anomalus]
MLLCWGEELESGVVIKEAVGRRDVFVPAEREVWIVHGGIEELREKFSGTIIGLL